MSSLSGIKLTLFELDKVCLASAGAPAAKQPGGRLAHEAACEAAS